MSGALRAMLSAVLLVLPATPPRAQQVVGAEIPAPLTDSPGNPGRGRELVRDAGNVTCLICHRMPFPDEPDQGLLGPDLAGVGSRLTPGELRLRLVDPKLLNADTIMPSYYRTQGLTRVGRAYAGRPIYSAQQIEDVVAFLSALKEAPP